MDCERSRRKWRLDGSPKCVPIPEMGDSDELAQIRQRRMAEMQAMQVGLSLNFRIDFRKVSTLWRYITDAPSCKKAVASEHKLGNFRVD